MSTLKSNGYLRSTSGLVYNGVPSLLTDMLLLSTFATEMEIPMSAILTDESSIIRMFYGFMSLCIILRLCSI